MAREHTPPEYEVAAIAERTDTAPPGGAMRVAAAGAGRVARASTPVLPRRRDESALADVGGTCVELAIPESAYRK